MANRTISTPATGDLNHTTDLTRPTDPMIVGVCVTCDGTGWADPWEVTDGAPLLTWCATCLGAGLDGCPTCEGEGVVPEPVACPCEAGERSTVAA